MTLGAFLEVLISSGIQEHMNSVFNLPTFDTIVKVFGYLFPI